MDVSEPLLESHVEGLRMRDAWVTQNTEVVLSFRSNVQVKRYATDQSVNQMTCD